MHHNNVRVDMILRKGKIILFDKVAKLGETPGSSRATLANAWYLLTSCRR